MLDIDDEHLPHEPPISYKPSPSIHILLPYTQKQQNPHKMPPTTQTLSKTHARLATLHSLHPPPRLNPNPSPFGAIKTTGEL
jgi:hypothetical protein